MKWHSRYTGECDRNWWEMPKKLVCKIQNANSLQISANLDKIEGADTINVRYLKMSILSVFSYKRSFQNRELPNAITVEWKLILTFCKKPLFPLTEIFQISPTLIFYPYPLPYRLKLFFYKKDILNTFRNCINHYDMIFGLKIMNF